MLFVTWCGRVGVGCGKVKVEYGNFVKSAWFSSSWCWFLVFYCLNKLVLLVDGVGPVIACRFLRGGMMLGPSVFLVLRSCKVCSCVASCSWIMLLMWSNWLVLHFV